MVKRFPAARRLLVFAILAVLSCASMSGCASNTSNASSSGGDQAASTSTSDDGGSSGSDSATSSDDSGESSPYTKPITQTLIRSLLRRGDDLYSRVRVLPDDTPSTQLGASELVNGDQGPIGSFYAKDRAYQADLPKANLGKDPSNLVDAASDLAEFETFAYSTAAAVASCNESDARRDLRVAKAYLDEAHRDYDGTAQENWEAPDTAESDTNAEECTQ